MNIGQTAVCSAIITLFLSLYASLGIASEAVLFEEEDDLLYISHSVGLYEDESNLLTITDVARLTDASWVTQKNQHQYLNYPSTTNNLWFKITIDNRSGEQLWLRSESAGAWIIDFYSPTSANNYRVLKLGKARPDENKVFPATHYVVPVTPGRKTYYMMMYSKFPTNTMFVVGKDQALYALNRSDTDFPSSIFIGIMIAMILYNMLSLVTIGDKVYIIYLGYLLGVLFLITFAMDSPLFSHIWFWDKFLIWANAVYLMAGLFSIKHLNLRTRVPTLYYLVVVSMIILIVPFSVLNYFELVSLVYLFPIWEICLVVLILLMFVSGVVVWIKGYQNARFYVIAWLPLIFSAIVYLTGFNGLIRLEYLNGISLYVGYGFEAVLFSVALGDRVNILKKEKYDLIIEQNEKLEVNVKNRTEELQKINSTKDKLFAIIGHDLRSPVNSLKGLLDLIDRGLLTQEEFETLTSKLKDSVNHMYETLNNMLHWANSQMNGFEYKPKKVRPFDLAEENVRLTKNIAAEKKITITNEISPDLAAYCDPEHIKLVFRNLISNALKFTPDEGRIRIGANTKRNKVEFCVRDYGVGMSREQVEKLFTDQKHKSLNGTRGEKGTGLGLTLCKDFVAKNGGEIRAESKVGEGTAIYFSVPKSN